MAANKLFNHDQRTGWPVLCMCSRTQEIRWQLFTATSELYSYVKHQATTTESFVVLILGVFIVVVVVTIVIITVII